MRWILILFMLQHWQRQHGRWQQWSIRLDTCTTTITSSSGHQPDQCQGWQERLQQHQVQHSHHTHSSSDVRHVTVQATCTINTHRTYNWGPVTISAALHQWCSGPSQSDKISTIALRHRGNVQRYQVRQNIFIIAYFLIFNFQTLLCWFKVKC